MPATNHILLHTARKLWRGHSRHGGKKNRRIQERRAMAFLVFCLSKRPGCQSLDEIGSRQVREFLASIAHLSPATIYGYGLAIRTLFALAGKPPPRVPKAPSTAKKTQCMETTEPLAKGVGEET